MSPLYVKENRMDDFIDYSVILLTVISLAIVAYVILSIVLGV